MTELEKGTKYLPALNESQCVRRCRIEWVVDDLQIYKLFVHCIPALGIHGAEMRGVKGVARNKMAVAQCIPGKVHPFRIQCGVQFGDGRVGGRRIVEIIPPSP